MTRMHAGRWRTVVVSAATVAVAAACSDSATGPTAANNAQLIARFQALSRTSQALHAGQLINLADRLSEGTPVGHGQISIGGITSTYAMIAELNVNDTAGVRYDSLLTFFAWSGPDADTVVEVEQEPGEMAILITDPDSLHLDSVTEVTPITTSSPGRRCTQPPGVSVPVDSSCRIETIMMPITAQLHDEPLPFVDFMLTDAPITAIRREFNDPTP